MRYEFYFLLIFSTLLEIIGDFLFKKWSIIDNVLFFIFGLILYIIGVYFFALSIKVGHSMSFGFGKTIIVFSIINILAACLVGVIFFSDNFSLRDFIGIALGMITIIILN